MSDPATLGFALSDHESSVMGLALQSDQKRVWSVSADHFVARYDIDDDVQPSVSLRRPQHVEGAELTDRWYRQMSEVELSRRHTGVALASLSATTLKYSRYQAGTACAAPMHINATSANVSPFAASVYTRQRRSSRSQHWNFTVTASSPQLSLIHLR